MPVSGATPCPGLKSVLRAELSTAEMRASMCPWRARRRCRQVATSEAEMSRWAMAGDARSGGG